MADRRIQREVSYNQLLIFGRKVNTETRILILFWAPKKVRQNLYGIDSSQFILEDAIFVD